MLLYRPRHDNNDRDLSRSKATDKVSDVSARTGTMLCLVCGMRMFSVDAPLIVYVQLKTASALREAFCTVAENMQFAISDSLFYADAQSQC